MTNQITYSFTFTLSKCVAISILVLGTIYAMMYRDITALTTSIITSAGLMGFKTGVDAYTNKTVTNLTCDGGKPNE